MTFNMFFFILSELKQKPKDGTVPGLGTLKYQGAMPCTVHEARILIYNDSDCHNMINRTGNNDSLITNAFCAGYLQGGIDTCQVCFHSNSFYGIMS